MKRVVMLIVLLVLLGMFATLAGADEVTIIKNPKPTCVEKEYRQLVKVRELKESEESEDFLVEPRSLVVDERGHIFAWDAAQAKIFQYDPDLNLVRTFCRRGQGPGEFGTLGHVLVNLFIRGKEIYLPDSYNRKVLGFSTDGEVVKEIPFEPKGLQNVSVALDRAGHVYLLSDNNPGNPHCIDCLDADGDFMRGYLDRSELLVGLYKKIENHVLAVRIPPGLKSKIPKEVANRNCYNMVMEGNLLFSVNRDSRLLVYSAISGRLWVFDQGKLTSASWLWPKRALEDFRERNLNIHRGYFPLFQSLVLDGDNADRFLLNYGSFREGDENYLYQFDLSGKVIRVFCVPNPERSFVRVYFKRNGQFYAIQRNQFENLTIAVYKEEKHE